MARDAFEERLADKPRDERREPTGGPRDPDDAAGGARQAFTRTFFPRSRAAEAAMPPEVPVVCGAVAPGAASVDTPRGAFEVRSSGTEARDRFETGQIGQRLPALRHSVRVARDRAHSTSMIGRKASGRASGSSGTSTARSTGRRSASPCPCARSIRRVLSG
ncbi:hypothetical protein ACLBWX_15080 [Methylobacterium sp. M6A4_1b]